MGSCHLWQMDRPREYYAKWNKSDRERQILCFFLYMESLKKKNYDAQNKTSNDFLMSSICSKIFIATAMVMCILSGSKKYW